jgi:hypothetical protein
LLSGAALPRRERNRRKRPKIGLAGPLKIALRHDDARSLLRAIYSTEIDLIPDPQAKTLTIRLHPLANAASDIAVRHLCAEINATETLFPATDLRLIYELVSAQSP